LISKAEHEIFKRFNTVALARVAENEFQIPEEPPFWLLPFLQQGEEANFRVLFNDPLSFIANFLVDAEQKWEQKSIGGISSGIYSIQTGQSPELFYECRADQLHEEPVLLVELIGEGSPGVAYESVRAARSQRLSDNVGLSQNREDLGSAADTFLNGLPALSAVILNPMLKNSELSSVVFNTGFKNLYITPDFQFNTLFEEIFGVEQSQKIWSQVQLTTSKRNIGNIPVKTVRNQTRLMQVELSPAQLVKNNNNHREAISIVLRDVTNRICADNWLSTLSDRSTTTGLLNIEMMNRFIKNAIKRSDESNHNFGLLYLKISGFESINDTYGKMTGNSLLSALAERLIETINPVHTVFHLQIDEFALLLENTKGKRELSEIENRVKAAVNQSYQLRYLTHNASVKVGLAEYAKGNSPEELLNSAKSVMTKS